MTSKELSDFVLHQEQTIATTIVNTSQSIDRKSICLNVAEQLDSIEYKYGGAYVWYIAASAAVGGLLFGYDLIVISGVLVMIGDDLHVDINSNRQELLTSITSAGAFLSALAAGLVLDRVGRRFVIACGALIFSIGSIIQASSYSIEQLVVGRFIVGVGIGEAAMVAPIYIAELSPARLRGRLVTLDALAIPFGECIAQAVNIGFQYVAHGWRYSIAIAVIPSVILFGLCWIIPDSPRFLIQRGRIEEAKAITAKIYVNATLEEVTNKVELIREQFQRESSLHNLTLKEQFRLLYHDRANLIALIVACGLMGIQQFAGTNALFYYAPTLFAVAGFDNSLAVSVVTNGANFLFTIFALVYLDSIGRRRFLVWTMWGMPLTLVIAAVAVHYIPISSDLTVTEEKITWASIVILVCIIMFIAFYAIALGNIPWQGTELFPMEVRSIGTMMITLTCWGCNIVVSATYLTMMKNITVSGTFGVYAAFTFIGWVCVLLLYPEVSGLSLEEIKEVFQHGFGVRYSLQLQKERKKIEKLNRIQ
ncbi:general substrate transporter [Lipomyces oligophaga]|uniref:general substrate transporter n=1 Tax=Lipomyces oligophaga TaxID=45792 RepID=UPI0034CFE7D5